MLTRNLICYFLKKNSGNILDDEELIDTLNDSKVTSGIITVRVKDAEVGKKFD